MFLALQPGVHYDMLQVGLYLFVLLVMFVCLAHKTSSTTPSSSPGFVFGVYQSNYYWPLFPTFLGLSVSLFESKKEKVQKEKKSKIKVSVEEKDKKRMF